MPRALHGRCARAWSRCCRANALFSFCWGFQVQSPSPLNQARKPAKKKGGGMSEYTRVQWVADPERFDADPDPTFYIDRIRILLVITHFKKN